MYLFNPVEYNIPEIVCPYGTITAKLRHLNIMHTLRSPYSSQGEEGEGEHQAFSCPRTSSLTFQVYSRLFFRPSQCKMQGARATPPPHS
jgi:hypothetical protein